MDIGTNYNCIKITVDWNEHRCCGFYRINLSAVGSATAEKAVRRRIERFARKTGIHYSKTPSGTELYFYLYSNKDNNKMRNLLQFMNGKSFRKTLFNNARRYY